MVVFNSIPEAMKFLKRFKDLDLNKIEDEFKTNACAKINGIGLVLIDELNIL
jgi:hypothetical protein